MLKKGIALLLCAVLMITTGGIHTMANNNPIDALWDSFQTVPDSAKTRPLWFWNNSLAGTTKEGIREIMVNSKAKSGYFGFAILPNWIDNYLSDEYMELYGYALETAKELGMTMILYDENGWPSGQAGGLLNQQYPGDTFKRLDKTEADVTGPASGSVTLPAGEYRAYIGAVAMNTDTKEIIDISDRVVYADPDAPGVYSSSDHPAIGSESYTADKAFDGNYSTRWNAGQNNFTDQWIEVNFGEATAVDRVILYEALDRITGYAVQYFDGEGWADAATGTAVGAKREITFPAVTAKKFRFIAHTTQGSNTLASICEMELFHDGNKIDIPQNSADNEDKVTYNVPEGSWKIMAFATVKDGYACVDYLNPDSVDKYIDVTFEAYYSRFAEYFGTVIDTAFFDEPAIYHAGGRTWTPEFNEMFEEKYGYDPITLYPAMWYDIGRDTEAARTALFGFRASLFSNYIGQVNDWCDAHGIQLTGHMDQEEPLNPTCITGDLMKSYQYEAIPGVDDIVNLNRSLKVYKLTSSAAYNYDKGLVMSESFGAMGEGVGITNIYKDTMGQFAKGVNFIVPHAIWYNNKEHIDNPPELSYRSEQYGPELAGFNEFAGRLQTMLQNGRHVADIGLLYPIDSLQGSFRFDVGNPYTGGITPDEADYMDVGELLSTTIHRDFTYLHPEVLSGKCSVNGSTIRLNNEVNYEDYKVMILPGETTIRLEALKKIKQFYDNGGKVIATTKLPSKASEFGKDAEVVKIIKEMFGVSESEFYPKSNITYASSSDYSGSYAAAYAFDGDSSEGSRWNAADQSGGDEWLEVDFGVPTNVNKTVVNENPPYRVTSYHIQYWDGGKWANCSGGTNIGETATNTFEPVTTTKLRLYIDSISDQSASVRECEVYYDDSKNLAVGQTVKHENSNGNGGKAIFLGVNYKDALENALDECLDTYDVTIDHSSLGKLADGSLSYIHKVKEGHDIFYFANTSDSDISTGLTLRGERKNLYLWDPHTGTRTKADAAVTGEGGNAATQVTLDLAAVHSVFLVDETEPEDIPGDLNGDGKVTAADVVALRRIIAGGEPTEQELETGDLDGSGTLDASDVTMLLRQLNITPGDVNRDGTAGALDIMLIRKAILEGTATDEQLASGDLDGNGVLGALDIMKLRKSMMEL